MTPGRFSQALHQNLGGPYLTRGVWDSFKEFDQIVKGLPPDSWKIMNAPSSGEPLKVYHGSDFKFESFDEEHRGPEGGYFFTTCQDELSAYGKFQYICLLKSSRPALVAFAEYSKPWGERGIEDAIHEVRDQGFDCLVTYVYDNAYAGVGGLMDVYVVFDPTKIEILSAS